MLFMSKMYLVDISRISFIGYICDHLNMKHI